MLAAAGAAARAWEVPLTAEDYDGVAGPRRITCGVPLLPGQAKDVKELRLLAKGADGGATPIPAQFRELARWWRADNSIRWVLVDFAAEVPAGGKLTFVLTNAKIDAPAPKAKLTVEQDESFITVATGPARFVINRKKFDFLEKAVLDLDGDGKLADDEDLLATTAECGTVTEDTFGQKYFGSAGTASVELLESGPMRVCVRARGKHPATGGKGFGPGLYSYDVFLNFYAGSTEVYGDVIVGNYPVKAVGTPAMEDGSLRLKLAGGVTGYRLLGERAVEGKLAAGESVCLYQDSNGADTWEKCPGFGIMETRGWKPVEQQLTSFRGYKVWKRAGGKSEELADGNHARGTLHAWNDRGGVVVHMKNFWRQFPKASEAGADGTVRIGLWPREWKFPHEIDDCAGKGHEIVLSFHGKERPKAEAIADPWDSRVFLRPPVEHIAACGALADLGPYTPPTRGLEKKPDTRTVANGPRMLTDDELYGNAYGWRIFGERWRSNGGSGTHGARQPINEDDYLYRWYVTGVSEWLAAGDARSRQFRDVRGYRVDDQDPMSIKDWTEYRETHVSENRERPLPQDEETKKYQKGLPDYGSPWEYPNPEHQTLDLLYDRYLLFGDLRSLENMRFAAANSAYFVRDHAPAAGAELKDLCRRIGRDSGWSWRVLDRYWELTGDKRAGELLRETIRNFEPVIGKSPLWFGGDPKGGSWFTQIFSRAVAMTALHTGDEKALEICRSLAVGKEKNSKTFSTLFAVLYHLTGEEQYKQAVLGGGEGEGLLSVGGYFPACDHWLLSQPPRKK
jgi:hypothetical protein